MCHREVSQTKTNMCVMIPQRRDAETGRMPGRGGGGRKMDGKKMANAGAEFSCHQFSCLSFLFSTERTTLQIGAVATLAHLVCPCSILRLGVVFAPNRKLRSE